MARLPKNKNRAPTLWRMHGGNFLLRWLADSGPAISLHEVVLAYRLGSGCLLLFLQGSNALGGDFSHIVVSFGLEPY